MVQNNMDIIRLLILNIIMSEILDSVAKVTYSLQIYDNGS